MENVKVFNQELSALYETKPPVSRAKMASLTKSAIKAIKFYKHVVQSVEKFVTKCRPEYKVPGLYVVDSIVRQSRHQFGLDKDVFAPRFTKNIVATFQQLYKCPAEDKSKIVRVLNLWQKNGVFPSEVIQPLMDLAPDPANPDAIARAQNAVVSAASSKESTKQPGTAPRAQPEEAAAEQAGAVDGLSSQNDVLKTVTELLQQSRGVQSLSDQQAQLQQLQLLQQQLMLQTQILQQPDQQDQPMIDSNLLSQIQQLTNQLLNKTHEEEQPTFNKKLLDFDYGESDEEDANQSQNVSQSQGDTIPGNVQNLLSDPGLINQIQQMSATIQKNEQLQGEQLSLQQQMEQMPYQQPPPQQQYQPMGDPQQVEEGEIEDNNQSEMQEFDEMGNRRDHRHRRSSSRSRSRRRRSRSRSRDRRRRSRSRDRHKRSKDRDRDRERDRERERQREKERERRKIGLPPVKEKMISVCSNTIWIGHLNKQTTEEDIRTELEKYGDVNNVALIAPRGCAYASLAARKSASKALDRLKGAKLLGNTLKASWAMGSGLRESAFKESWDMDLGVSYIPWESLEDVQLEKLAEGATIDEESLPEHLRKEREQQHAAAEAVEMQTVDPGQPPVGQMPGIMGPGPGPGILPGQPMPGMMPVLPAGMPPMMGMPPLGVPPPGMPGVMAGQVMAPPQRPLAPGMPGVPTSLPAALLPNNQITSGGETPNDADPMLSKLQFQPPGSMAGNSLQLAIQNIVNNSASITAVAQGGPGVRPLVQLTPGIRPALAPALTRLPPAFPQPQMPGQLPGSPAMMPQTNFNIPTSLVGMRLIGQPAKPLNLEENAVLANGPPVSMSDPELNREPNKGVRLPFMSMHQQGGPPPGLVGQDASPPRMMIRPEGPGGGLVRLDSPTISHSPRPVAPMFNQRFPGPRGNPDGPPDADGDLDRMDGPISLMDNQVRFPRPMGPRGMPMRGFPPGMPPHFGMRGMPMRPGFDRGPPPFGHERMDFRPFGRGGPRHRGDFRGRGRGFRGGRGGGPDRFRNHHMDSMDSDDMPSDKMMDDDDDSKE